MKSKILLFIIISLMITGCTGTRSSSYGLNKEAYLEVYDNEGKYPETLQVLVNNEKMFEIVTNKLKTGSVNVKTNAYAIPAGKVLLKISNNQEIIYQKQIFISSQETKKITLQ